MNGHANVVSDQIKQSGVAEAFFGSLLGSLQRLEHGLKQPYVNIVDAYGMTFETLYLIAGGRGWRYEAYGDMGQAAEDGVSTGELAYGVAAGLGTLAADVVTIGGYATYQYNSGQLIHEEYGDRILNASLTIFGARNQIAGGIRGIKARARSPRLNELGEFSNMIEGRVSASEIRHIENVLKRKTGTTIVFDSPLAQKRGVGNHFDKDKNMIHLQGGATKQRKGVFYEEVQHAFDHHANLYENYWAKKITYFEAHSITAWEIINNPLFKITEADVMRLLQFIRKHGVSS